MSVGVNTGDAAPLSAATMAKAVVRYGAAVSGSNMLQQATALVILAFVGRMGPAYIGGASLAMSLFNATAFAMAVGLGGGLDTLLSQVYGNSRGDHLYGILTQRMVFILLVMSFPIALLFAYVDVPLTYLGLPAEAVHFTTRYCHVSLFNIVPIQLLEVVRRYLQNQHQTRIPLVAQIVGGVCNPLLLYLFIYGFGMGFEGAPAAWVTLHVCIVAGIVAYVKFFWPAHAATWPGWHRSALSEWGPVLRQGLPSWSLSMLEWGAFEINALASGFLPATDLAAFSICVQVFSVMWCTVSGNFFAMSFFTGEAVGRGDGAAARRFAKVGIATAFCVSAVNAALLVAFRFRVAALFTDDAAVIARVGDVAIAAAALHVVDSQQSTCIFILRGIGKHHHGVAVLICTWIAVGLPLGWLLAFHFRWGAPGLFLGLACSLVFLELPIFAVMFRRFDWDALTAVEIDRSPVTASPPGSMDNMCEA
jgi:MATE family multidrug resistance protein